MFVDFRTMRCVQDRVDAIITVGPFCNRYISFSARLTNWRKPCEQLCIFQHSRAQILYFKGTSWLIGWCCWSRAFLGDRLCVQSVCWAIIRNIIQFFYVGIHEIVRIRCCIILTDGTTISEHDTCQILESSEPFNPNFLTQLLYFRGRLNTPTISRPFGNKITCAFGIAATESIAGRAYITITWA